MEKGREKGKSGEENLDSNLETGGIKRGYQGLKKEKAPKQGKGRKNLRLVNNDQGIENTIP